MLELYRPVYRQRAEILVEIPGFYRTIVCASAGDEGLIKGLGSRRSLLYSGSAFDYRDPTRHDFNPRFFGCRVV
jgi:hypothetical protein